jgi:hypothetical protein
MRKEIVFLTSKFAHFHAFDKMGSIRNSPISTLRTKREPRESESESESESERERERERKRERERERDC